MPCTGTSLLKHLNRHISQCHICHILQRLSKRGVHSTRGYPSSRESERVREGEGYPLCESLKSSIHMQTQLPFVRQLLNNIIRLQRGLSTRLSTTDVWYPFNTGSDSTLVSSTHPAIALQAKIAACRLQFGSSI